MTEVLSVASEAFPLVKTGGLADVVGALPAALAPLGVTMRILLPGYPPVLQQLDGSSRTVAEFDELFGGKAHVRAGRASGLDLIVVDAPHLFDRPGNIYLGPDGKDWPDNWRRFAALSYVAGRLANGLVEGYQPDIVHAHDWQAGLAPVYVKYGANDRARSIITVHNIAFQGYFGWEIFHQLYLPDHAANETLEYYGGIGYLKAGLISANVLSTVSPTYAAEVRTAAYGNGLEGLMQTRTKDLHGILNGIDTDVWDPMADTALTERYNSSTLDLRQKNKRALEQRFELDDSPGPLFGIVSRLTWQKGMDLLVPCVDQLVAEGGKLCILGSGEPGIENGLRGAAMRHPGRVGLVTGYDEKLSHLIQGGADVMLVPSRFEPCGLTQLYGLRYGCVPLVCRVGGLADTIIDANEAAVGQGVSTGLQFFPASEHALADAITRTIRLYGDEKFWRKMQRRGMKADVSWENSAKKYASLYEKLLESRP
jgi:starch synthase